MENKWFIAISEKKNDSFEAGGIFVGTRRRKFYGRRAVNSFHDKLEYIVRDQYPERKIAEITLAPQTPPASLYLLPRRRRVTQFRGVVEFIPRIIYRVTVFLETGTTDWDEASSTAIGHQSCEESGMEEEFIV